MIRSVDLTVWVILEVLKLSIPEGTQVQWKKSAEICRHRSVAGAQIRRHRSAAAAEVRRQFIGHRAQVRRKSLRHSAWVRRCAVGNSVYLYAGITWVKLRTYLEIYLAVHVYHCCVLGFEVMSGFWYYDSILRSDRVCFSFDRWMDRVHNDLSSCDLMD